MEDKGHALAVHTRRAAEPEVARTPAELVAALAERTGVVEPGRFVLELRPPGMDKGGARALAAELRPRRSSTLATILAIWPRRRPSPPKRAPGVKVCSSSDEVTLATRRSDRRRPGVVDLVESLSEQLG